MRCPIYEIMFLRRILLLLARPGTQCDRSLMRPVTAPCSHHPPTLQEIYGCPVGMLSPEQDPPGARATRRRSPCSGSCLPARAAVCISTPGPGNACLWQGSSYLTARPFKGGRSAARRVVNGGMPVHPRKRAKHGWRVPGPSGPSEHRNGVRR